MNDLLLVGFDVAKRFPVKTPHGHGTLHAVDGVSFEIRKGETLGLVGESGCGKSTLVRLLTRTLDLTEGQVRFLGKDLGLVAARAMPTHPSRRDVQMVFQDPHDSLDPRCTAFDVIAEPLLLLEGLRDAQALRERVQHTADQVGLPRELLQRFPHQLSGGQKARVGIARAIAVKPRLLVLDEPTAALDVSVQVVILHLLARLKEELGMSFLFVSHDLNVVRLLCDRVLVMYLGRIVESGPAAEVFARPMHPYTRALVGSIPGSGQRTDTLLRPVEPRSPIDPSPTTCRFMGRCPHGEPVCESALPQLRELDTGSRHAAACHRLETLERTAA